MPKYMPSRSDVKQGLGGMKRGRPRTRFGTEVDPAVAAGLMPAPRPRPRAMPPMPMKNGGSASSRADGCCTKGKTKGKIL